MRTPIKLLGAASGQLFGVAATIFSESAQSAPSTNLPRTSKPVCPVQSLQCRVPSRATPVSILRGFIRGKSTTAALPCRIHPHRPYCNQSYWCAVHAYGFQNCHTIKMTSSKSTALPPTDAADRRHSSTSAGAPKPSRDRGGASQPDCHNRTRRNAFPILVMAKPRKRPWLPFCEFRTLFCEGRQARSAGVDGRLAPSATRWMCLADL